MDLQPNETQRLIQSTAHDFAQKRLLPAASAIDREGVFPESVIRELGSLGLMGVNIPDAYGGAEAGPIAYVLAMMEIARGCASTAVTMGVTNMVNEVIATFGTDAQRTKYVPALCSGELLCGAFGLSEAEAGSDPGNMHTTAVQEGDTWVINGEKMWISHGDKAGVIILWARTGSTSTHPGTKGISAFLIDAGTPGLRIGRHEDKLGLRGSTTVTLELDNCRVPSSALLGSINGGFKIAMMALDGGRLGIASQAIGIATAAQEEAVDYAKQRKQFGKPIASFQAIQWMLADSQTELDAARMLTLRAAWKKEHKLPFSQEASMAKLYASEMVQRVCARAFQVHGGMGFTKEAHIERHLRDCRVATIYEGTSEIQRMVIAKSLLS